MTGARTSERAFFGFASLTGTSQPDSWNLTTSLSSAWALRGGTRERLAAISARSTLVPLYALSQRAGRTGWREGERVAQMAGVKRAEVGATEHEADRWKFKCAKPKAKPQARKVWKVSDLTASGTEIMCTKPPPKCVLDKLVPCDLMAAIDVETHDMVPKEGSLVPWSLDRFGLQSKTTMHTLSTLRIIQLGWAVGTSTEDMVVKSIMVRPDGFEVSSEAVKMHGITQEKLEIAGVPLDDALQVMVTDVLQQCSRGARLVAHNLPFDAGLVYEELGRAGLSHLQSGWADAVRGGICTMDPDVGTWAKSMIGLEDKSRSIPVGLKTLVSGFVPGANALLRAHHTADGDAAMHLALCRKLVSLCRA